MPTGDPFDLRRKRSRPEEAPERRAVGDGAGAGPVLADVVGHLRKQGFHAWYLGTLGEVAVLLSEPERANAALEDLRGRIDELAHQVRELRMAMRQPRRLPPWEQPENVVPLSRRRRRR